MSNTWWTSDLHLGHVNIIEYCKRPFTDVNQMNEALIANWNETVGPDDRVFILGDFSFAPPEPFFNQLNGLKSLVLGNHDERRRSQLKRLPWFEPVAKKRWVIMCDGTVIYMSHYPDDEVTDHYDLYLHGHSHGTVPNTRKRCDVGVDCWDFRPVSLEQIVERLALIPE